MVQNAASDLGLYCLPFIQQFLDRSAGSKMDLFKFWDMYGKDLRCPNTYGKYGNHTFLNDKGHGSYIAPDKALFSSEKY